MDRLFSNDREENPITDLRSLFETADLVKFAKHNPLMNENDANLINAIEFINETKEKEVENAKPQPTEITIIEKRSLRTKILLGIGIVVLSVALIGSFVYIGMQLPLNFAIMQNNCITAFQYKRTNQSRQLTILRCLCPAIF